MAHTLTLLTRVRVRRVSLDQGKYRVEVDVFYLLRFFLTMPSRDTPASSRTEASMAALVRSAARRRGRTRKCEMGIGTAGGGGLRKVGGGAPSRSIVRLPRQPVCR